MGDCPHRSRVRKITSSTIVFLLLGAIVNVGVAWGCGVVVSPTFNNDLYASLDDDPEVNRFTRCSNAIISRGVGTARAQFSEAFVYVAEGRKRPSHQLPYWVMGGARHTWGSPEWRFVNPLDVQAQGWPLLALSCEIKHHRDVSGGVVLRREATIGAPMHVLALRPIWRGFAINTLFYAAILCLLFAAPFSLRRRLRIRRGLCPACAYPIGESVVCTECGRALPQPNAVSPDVNG